MKLFLLALLLSFAHCTISYATCGDLMLTPTVFIPTVHTNVVNLPPQFTNVTVECDTVANTLCSNEINVADTAITLNTTTPGAYTNLNDYNFLRSNKSIFPTLDNEVIITPTFFVSPTNGFGFDIALSGDGSILAVGSINFDNTIQRVDIYRRINDNWVPFQIITPPPTINGTIGFGGALAISDDGSVLAIGTLNWEDTAIARPTYVFVYTYDTINGTYLLAQTIASSSLGGFGKAIRLSANGDYIVISEDHQLGIGAASISASAWVYIRENKCSTPCTNTNTWVPQAQLIPINDDGSALDARVDPSNLWCGYLDISGDGSTIALGWPRTRINSIITYGIVALFTRHNETWTQTQLLIGPSQFGGSVALSNDGSYLAISGFNLNTTYIFSRQGTKYTEEKILPTFGALTLSLSADGTVLVDHSLLRLFISLRGPDNSWATYFTATPSTPNSQYYSAACSADGAFVAVGIPQGLEPGYVKIYRSTGSFIPNDTTVTGTLCIYQHATINAPLRVAGDIHLNNTIVTGTGLVTPCTAVLSDRRTKDKITSLDPVAALEKLRSLQPVIFFWKDTTHNAPSQQIGFIAQHMKKIFPHWVSRTEAAQHEKQWLEGNKQYMITIKAELYAYLIAALEQLVQRNTEQKAAIIKLQQKTH